MYIHVAKRHVLPELLSAVNTANKNEIDSYTAWVKYLLKLAYLEETSTKWIKSCHSNKKDIAHKTVV